MLFVKFVLLTLLHLPFSWGSKNKSCPVLLGELGQAEVLYIECATKHSVPVSLCNGCMLQHQHLTEAFDTLRGNCTDMYFDQDRLNLVAATYHSLTGLWTSAFCEDCFHGNNSDTFDAKSQNFNYCLLMHKGQECDMCVAQYNDLNTFYTQLDEHNNGHVCYDLQDAMNRTRSYWSKGLHCCRRIVDLTLFIVASTLMTSIPVIFYVGMYMLTKHRERNHGILVEGNNDVATPRPTTSALISSAQLAVPPVLDEDNERLQDNTQPIFDLKADPSDIDDSDDLSDGEEYVVNKV